jgi:hypothetical protein
VGDRAATAAWQPRGRFITALRAALAEERPVAAARPRRTHI